MSEVNVHLTSRLELSRDKVINLISAVGQDSEFGRGQTVLVQGAMGNGKTQILIDLAEMFPSHVPCYVDIPTMDVGDFLIPHVKEAVSSGGNLDDLRAGETGTTATGAGVTGAGTGASTKTLQKNVSYTVYAPNEAFGIHLGKPVIIMLDELLKGKRSVIDAGLRLCLERQLGNIKLHPDSIIFATSNLDEEGLGDLLLPHQRQRFLPIVMQNLTKEAVIEHGSNKGWHPAVLGFMAEHGNVLFQSFKDVSDHRDNPHIFHPQAEREAFWTPRGAEQCSQYTHLFDRGLLDKHTLRVALARRVGEPTMRMLMTYIELSADMPTTENIKDDPQNCTVPENSSAQFMLAGNALATIDKDWVNQWIEYMGRLLPEVQALFALCVKPDTYKKRELLANNAKFMQWCLDNNHLFN